MKKEPQELFADADIFYPSAVPGFCSWGSTGMAVLRRLQNIVRERLEAIGYAELCLPTVCQWLELEKFMGSKSNCAFEISARADSRLGLAPFSDLQYLHHFALTEPHPYGASKAYQWSRCFVNDAGRSFLDFGEYLKCDVFAICGNREQSIAAFDCVNELYRSLCLEVLCIEPLVGTRPRVTSFPEAEASWSAELGQRDSDTDTIIVSHRMSPSLVEDYGFRDLTGMFLNSSGFSQKLLALTLIHHRDARGIRFPPALAPVIGMVGPQFGQWGKHDTMESRIERSSTEQDVLPMMLARGAVWGLQRDTGSEGGEWILHLRGDLDGRSVRFYSSEAALLEARRRTEALSLTMLKESRATMRSALWHVSTLDQLQDLSPELAARAAVCAACCLGSDCQRSVILASRWIPKLCFEDPDTPGTCCVCGSETKVKLLFECSPQRYTGWQLPVQCDD